MRRTLTALVGAVVVVPLLAACGGDAVETAGAPTRSTPSGGASTTSEPAPTAAPTAGGTPSAPAGTAPQTAESSGDWDLVLTDVRAARHDGFDRIVLELAGTGVPGWSVAYADEAVKDGSGEKVALGGDTVLDVYASGTTYPESGGYAGPRQLSPVDAGAIAEVHVVGWFEGYTQVLVGIDGDRVPFRVFALADPPRLVVDVGAGAG